MNTEIASIARALTTAFKAPVAALWGKTPLQQALVAQWLDYAVNAEAATRAGLDRIDAALLTQSFLGDGAQPSVADIVMYWTVRPAVVSIVSPNDNDNDCSRLTLCVVWFLSTHEQAELNDTDKLALRNLSRW